MHRKKFKRHLFVLSTIILFSLSALFLPIMSVSASPHQTDPMVAVAVDLTSPQCTITKTVSDPRTHAVLSKAKIRCPKYSLAGIGQEHLSEARAQRKQYVVLPTSTPFANDQIQIAQQKEQLLLNALNHHSSTTQPSIAQGGDCGMDLSWDEYDPNIYGWADESILNYYVSTNCNTVALSSAEVHGDSTNGSHSLNFYGFTYSNYGGQRWGPPDCSNVSVGNAAYWPSYLNGLTSGQGGTFTFLMSIDGCVGLKFTGASMYPIN